MDATVDNYPQYDYEHQPMEYIKDASQIKLRHVVTDKALHTHDVRPSVSDLDFQNEVSAYGMAGCGSKRHWSPSRLEFTPGQWIPKAMCARHRNIDKSTCYLEGSTNESEGVSETSIGGSSSLGDARTPDRNDLPSPLADMDNRSGDAAILQVKEETDAVEETLHDLVHLCSAVTQRAMSFSSDPEFDLFSGLSRRGLHL
ncbi:hypothetical protein V8B97DRAFT_2040142 [Scleroderma yunnanense]